MEYDEEVAKRIYGEELVEDVAINLLKMGLSIEQISQATRLSEEVIQRLESEI
jgi:predicted transposase YdaD